MRARDVEAREAQTSAASTKPTMTIRRVIAFESESAHEKWGGAAARDEFTVEKIQVLLCGRQWSSRGHWLVQEDGCDRPRLSGIIPGRLPSLMLRKKNTGRGFV